MARVRAVILAPIAADAVSPIVALLAGICDAVAACMLHVVPIQHFLALHIFLHIFL
jgi:cytochrome c biogenesis protein CcdA